MITDFKKLSDALDRVAPAPSAMPAVENVLAAIRDNRVSIESEIKETGLAHVTVDGRTIVVRRSDSEESGRG